MRALANLSNIVIPMVIFFVVGYGFVSKVKVYETFLKGATDGLKIVVDIVHMVLTIWVFPGTVGAVFLQFQNHRSPSLEYSLSRIWKLCNL